jgi:hypothetical protein
LVERDLTSFSDALPGARPAPSRRRVTRAASEPPGEDATFFL